MTDADGAHRSSAAQAYALVVGGTLALAGVLGFFYSASFTTGDVDRDAVLGILDVNGWHNLVHLGSGVVGLAVAGSFTAARTYAGALGVVYLLVTIAGFAYGDGEAILGILPINTEDNVLHLLIAVAGLGAYFAGSPEPAPSTAG